VKRFNFYIPVFNGEKFIDETLRRIEASGYLPSVRIIDDASTDSTPNILKRWQNEKGLTVTYMRINGQKISSIKQVLEQDDNDGRLSDYIVLHDADSFISVDHQTLDGNEKVLIAIEKAISFMEDEGWSAMGIKDVPYIVYNESTIFESFQYWEYVWDRATHYWLGKAGFMRCIPGAGGIFKTKPLLEALKKHSLKHDGDDMETTVLIQSLGYKVGYYSTHVLKERGYNPEDYPEIVVNTNTPRTFVRLLKQRVRWTVGAVEVYLKEGKFHLKQMWNRNRLGLQAIYEVLKLITYPGWYYAAWLYPMSVIPISIVATGLLNTFFLIINPEYADEHDNDKIQMAFFLCLSFLPIGLYSFILDTIRIPLAYLNALRNILKGLFVPLGG